MSTKQKGYTVVEVMLFLAISGALLSVSIIGMNGQQDRLRFQQSMQDIEFRIRNTLNNVDQGYLAKPDDNVTYSCNGAVSAQVSSRSECVFVGKEVDMCSGTGDFFIQTLVAPYRNADYTNPGTGLGSGAIVSTAREDFKSPGGVRIVDAGNPCRVSAQYQVLGTNNSKVPRYVASQSGSWTAANDTNPPVLCFIDANGTNQYAKITITQADVKLEVNTGSC
jgi:type II secretory pathway pseudopilin PulG